MIRFVHVKRATHPAVAAPKSPNTTARFCSRCHAEVARVPGFRRDLTPAEMELRGRMADEASAADRACAGCGHDGHTTYDGISRMWWCDRCSGGG
jgi:hypothetical protein